MTTEKLLIAFNQNGNRELAGVGDSILDLVLKEHAYKNPEATPETIDDIRQTLANHYIMKDIVTSDIPFQKFLKEKHMCTSPVGNFGKERCDAFMEATIAAIYYDKDYETTKKFIMKIFEVKEFSC